MPGSKYKDRNHDLQLIVDRFMAEYLLYLQNVRFTDITALCPKEGDE